MNIVNILKRPAVWGTFLSIAVIAVLSIAYFYPDDVNGGVLQQHDVRQGAAIGHEAALYAAETGHTPRWTNSLFGGMPTFQISPSYQSTSWFSWLNKVMGLGLPSPANLLAMMMIGFFILGLSMQMRWYVALIAAIGYGLSSYFIIIIGAGHIWKFITLAYVPPTIAGIVLVYRGRYLLGAAMAALFAMLQIAGNHVQMTYYFMFVIVGFVIAYLAIAIRNHNMTGWCKATGALVIAAGLAVGANLPGLYNTYEYSRETMRGNHSELTGGTAEAVNSSDGGLNRDYITQYSYGVEESWSLLIPNIKGGASAKPVGGKIVAMSMADTPQIREMASQGQLNNAEVTVLGYMSQYFGEPEGTNGPVYVGALIVALFLLGMVIVKGPVKWVLVILTILSIMLALGRNCMWLTDFMIDHMPMYNRFRTVESILVIAEFTMPVLAMLALQKILVDKDALRKWRTPLLWSFGFAMFVCLLAVLMPSLFGALFTEQDININRMILEQMSAGGASAELLRMIDIQSNPVLYTALTATRRAMIQADALRSFIIVAAGLGILLLYLYRKLNLGVAAILVGILICGDLYLVNKRYLDSDSFVQPRLTLGQQDQFPLTESDRIILRDTAMNYRVMDLPRFWSADPSYHHKTVGGYHAAKLTRYQDMIDRHLEPFLQGAPDAADFGVLNMLNARYIVTNPSEQPMYNDQALGNAWFVDSLAYVDGADAEMDALDRIDVRNTAVADRQFQVVLGIANARQPGDTIFETSYAPDRLTYHASSANGGVAVFSEIYFPWGWNVSIDGAPAELGRVNYLLRAIRLPAGQHTVEMVFDPQSVRLTESVAKASIALIYALVLLAVLMGCITAYNRHKA